MLLKIGPDYPGPNKRSGFLLKALHLTLTHCSIYPGVQITKCRCKVYRTGGPTPIRRSISRCIQVPSWLELPETHAQPFHLLTPIPATRILSIAQMLCLFAKSLLLSDHALSCLMAMLSTSFGAEYSKVAPLKSLLVRSGILGMKFILFVRILYFFLISSLRTSVSTVAESLSSTF